MFKKFFKFLKGYVIIRITGKGAERFVNICIRRGIDVWNTKPCENGIELCVLARDFRNIRGIVKKCKVRVRIVKKDGFGRVIRRYRKRYMFLVGLVLCAAFCITASQRIWLVEINGVERSDINSIIATLDRVGIKNGAKKSALPEKYEIKNAILNDTDNIAWAWVYIEGVKARVEIYEQTIPPDIIDKKTPCDIVASRDGVIERMIVKNGEEIAAEGDAVKAGDVIVSGKVASYKEGSPEEYIYVHSMAEVQAYTTHSKSGEYKLYYESRIPTGKRKKRCAIEICGKVFSLPGKKIDYENYDVKEKRHELYIPFFGYSGIAVNTTTYYETSINREPISVETSLDFAKNDLEAKISKEISLGSTLTDENLEYTKTDNETINVKLEMNFIQNIAVERELGAEDDKGEETFDKQTDRSAAGG